MGLFGSSEVEDSVSSSVEEVEVRKDDVEVDQLRSPQELIDQVDRLEKTVESLRVRQEEIIDCGSGKNEADLNDVIDGRLSRRNKNVDRTSYEFDETEERLEMLEVAVSRLESGFEMSADDLREEVLEEAFEFENSKLDGIEGRVNRLEDELENIEERVHRSEFKELQDKVEEMSKIILELSKQQNS
jgi:DNA anti-recombination protein RmuC